MKDARTDDEFFKGLSEAEWEDASALAGIASVFSWGSTEEVQAVFLRAGIELKRAKPTASGGDQINAGLVAVGQQPLTPKPVRKRGSTLK